MNAKFEPIKITGFEDELTEPSGTSPAHRRLHLKLSNTPTYEWEQLFNEQRNSHMHSKTRRSAVEGDYIVVDCPPVELKNQHEELKQDLIAVNAKYQELMSENAANQKTAASAQAAEKNKLKEIKSDLNFD